LLKDIGYADVLISIAEGAVIVGTLSTASALVPAVELGAATLRAGVDSTHGEIGFK